MHTCFHVTARAISFLIDCGASALISMRRYGVDPTRVDTVFLTHLHGDHFGGLPFLILDAQLVSRRTAPLTIVGPPGLGNRLSALMEAMFPGSSKVERRFETRLIELAADAPATVNGVDLTAFTVRHPSGAPSYALRFACEGKILCYTGDTEWIDSLVPAARDADLLIAEGYTFERPVRFHLDWASLRAHLPELHPRRILLTHMSPDMLARTPDGYEAAEDGQTIAVD